MEKVDILEHYDLDDILQLSDNNPLIIDYLKRKKNEKVSRISANSAFSEISTYNGVLEVLYRFFDYRWQEDRNPLILIGALNHMTRSDNSYLFKHQQPLILEESNDNSINGYEGIEVLNGHATREELASFFKDMFDKFGFTSYLVEAELKERGLKNNDLRKVFVNDDNDALDVTKPQSYTCDCTDYGIIFEFDNCFYFYEPTDMVLCEFSKENSLLAIDMYGDSYYTISPISFMVYDSLTMKDINELIKRFGVRDDTFNHGQILDLVKEGLGNSGRIDHDICKLINPLVGISMSTHKMRKLDKKGN